MLMVLISPGVMIYESGLLAEGTSEELCTFLQETKWEWWSRAVTQDHVSVTENKNNGE